MTGRRTVHGVGVDLVALPRFARFARDHRDKLDDLFSAAEQARGTRGLARAWALKEATLKAIGGLAGWDVPWTEIRVDSDSQVSLEGSVAAHAKKLGISSLAASCTITKGAALASVIALARGT